MKTVPIAVAMLAAALALPGGCAQPSTRTLAPVDSSSFPVSKDASLDRIACGVITAIEPPGSGKGEVERGNTSRETFLIRVREDSGGFWTVTKGDTRGTQETNRYDECAGRR